MSVDPTREGQFRRSFALDVGRAREEIVRVLSASSGWVPLADLLEQSMAGNSAVNAAFYGLVVRDEVEMSEDLNVRLPTPTETTP